MNMYINVLMQGCRCVELDCHDGPDMEPIIYHGRTLTTRIKLRAVVQVRLQVPLSSTAAAAVIVGARPRGATKQARAHRGVTWTPRVLLCQAVREFGFRSSVYPVILSLEMHCSLPQQRRVADILRSELGPLLLGPLSDDESFAVRRSPLPAPLPHARTSGKLGPCPRLLSIADRTPQPRLSIAPGTAVSVGATWPGNCEGQDTDQGREPTAGADQLR